MRSLYQQKHSMAVGSPLSPVVDIYMEFYKELAMYITTFKPALWLRYVDDMFVIWKYNMEETMRTSIRFNMEKKEDGAISFLDVLGRNVTEDDSL
jgi:hypothetical protein